MSEGGRAPCSSCFSCFCSCSSCSSRASSSSSSVRTFRGTFGRPPDQKKKNRKKGNAVHAAQKANKWWRNSVEAQCGKRLVKRISIQFRIVRGYLCRDIPTQQNRSMSPQGRIQHSMTHYYNKRNECVDSMILLIVVV